MPMGIVSDLEFSEEFENLIPSSKSDKKELPQAEVKEIERGRGKGNVEVPESLRKLIGDTSKSDGRTEALALAEQFGIGSSSASAYGVGANSTATYDTKPNESTITNAKERITKRARNKLMMALKHITEEKLGTARVRDISSIAKDMSIVMRNMEDKIPINPLEKNGPTFVFYSPHFKTEESFKTIQVKE